MARISNNNNSSSSQLCCLAIIGSAGAGKTTLACQVAQQLGLNHIELDALYWDADWTPASHELFRSRTAAALNGRHWVADGNYSIVRDIVWGRADSIVWLDYPLWLVLWRVWWRTLRRIWGREMLWNGNREHWHNQFFSRDSLFLWIITSHQRRRREYPTLFARPEYAHLHIVRLCSPRATQRWLEALPPPT